MPFMGLGIHVLIAFFFAVHAIRTGQERYWLSILFMFPLLGSLAYFVVIYYPSNQHLRRGMRQAADAAVKILDPGKELREAREAYDLTPTAQNQVRLARACLEAGDIAQAADLFESCLHGPFANDPEMRLDAARARMRNKQPVAALDLLMPIRQKNPDFRPEQIGLLVAQAYAALGRHREADAEFVQTAHRFGSVESRAEYAIWALERGQMEVAQAQYREIERAQKYWNRYTRDLHAPLMQRLEAAFAAVQKP